MKITGELTDAAVLKELGERIAWARIEQNRTQAALAEEAGVSKRTIERLESGEVATQLSGFLRVCRVLGLLDRLENFLPEAGASPMAQLKQAGRRRQRATGMRSRRKPASKWTWEETP